MKRWVGLTWQRLSVVAVLFAGVAFSAVEFHLLRSLETQKAAFAFGRAANERFDELQSDLQLSVIRVNALGAFCESTYPVTRQAFDRFAAPLTSGPDASIQALEWAPKVSHGERLRIEELARAEGFSEFEFRDRLQQGKMVRAGDRAEYFPVLWVFPYEGNEPALGFDIAFNASRHEALSHAAATAESIATKRVTLVQETGSQYGILIFQPVFRRTPVNASRELLGFALGVLRVGSVVEKHGAHSGIDLTITDLDADAADQQLYPSDASRPKVASTFTERRTIRLGGRKWLLAASPSPGAFPLNRTYSFLGFALSLLITFLVSVYLWISLFARIKVEQLVEKRTVDLNDALTSLNEVHRGLEESEVRYRRLVEDSPNAIVVEQGGKIVLANRNFVKLFGIDPVQDDKEHNMLEFVAPERKVPAEEFLQGFYAENKQVSSRETFLLRNDGTIINAEISASSFSDAGQRSIQVIVRDISQRKRTEAENARLILAIEQAAESIVITDIAANIVYVNPAFERISGYSRQEAIGKNPRVLKSGRQPAEFYVELWDRLKAGESWTGRFINRCKNGRLYDEEATISPVVNSAGEIVNYVAVKRDVTRELELQEQLLQSRKMDAVGRLAGGVAHDFNNMLMVMTSYAELLAANLPEGDPLRKHTDGILRAAERSSALTRQLLTLSRKQVFAPKVLDCNTILTETSNMVRRLIGENIELKCDLASDLWRVMADADQIVQVIINLCVNARDAMPNGGLLTLTSRNFRLNEGYVEISVTDTGVGIPLEAQEKLFEPFFTTKAVGKGTGLGLSTVYSVVEQSGGHLRVESAPGEGATFRVYLPRCRASASPSTESFAAQSKTDVGLVLVVEDEDALREAISEQLCNHGFSVLSACDGVEAMEILAGHAEVEYLITDLIMPRMGGRELVRNASKALPHLRVLVLSGYADQMFSYEECNGCPTIFLQKPFSLGTMLSTLSELSGRPQTANLA
jgi:PAS domain S-box-containing protein